MTYIKDNCTESIVNLYKIPKGIRPFFSKGLWVYPVSNKPDQLKDCEVKSIKMQFKLLQDISDVEDDIAIVSNRKRDGLFLVSTTRYIDIQAALKHVHYEDIVHHRFWGSFPRVSSDGISPIMMYVHTLDGQRIEEEAI